MPMGPTNKISPIPSFDPKPNRQSALWCVAIALVITSSGCGDPCEDAIQELCEKSCDCEGTSACNTTFGDSSGGITLGYDSADDCAALFANGCEDGVEDQIDGEACQASISDATCGDTGLIVPADCGGQ